jgi:hypothetical protein
MDLTQFPPTIAAQSRAATFSSNLPRSLDQLPFAELPLARRQRLLARATSSLVAPPGPTSPLQGQSSSRSLTKTTRKRDRLQRFLGTFRGTANIVLGYLNPFGVITSTNTLTTQAVLTVDRPQEVGNAREKNLFSLEVSSSDAELNQNLPGSFQMYSAFSWNLVQTPVAQYWDLKVQGRKFSGTLVDTFANQGLALNYITSNRTIAPGVAIPSPFLMEQGTWLTGRANPRRIQLQFQGADTTLTRSFVITVTTSR